MGILALLNMALALFAAVAIYQLASAAWRIPMLLNLPGAFAIFNATVSASGWLLHPLFDSYMHIPAPDVPWYAWLVYLGLALIWYSTIVFLLAKWRQGSETTPEANR